MPKQCLLFFILMLFTTMPFTKIYAYETDNKNNIITVSPSNDPIATTQDLQKAITYLSGRPDTNQQWAIKLKPQKYFLTQQISTTGLKNTTITSFDASQPAQLIKAPNWDSAKSGEYILSLRMCDHITISNIEFYGQTDFSKSVNSFWPDQGVYIGSCNIVNIDSNKFYNFGNAALRVVTDAKDPVKGVNSFKTHVTHNTFNNIYQTATTATDLVHGGTAQSTWDYNTFYNIRGSIKFASRVEGAKHIEFFNNTINGGDHFGLEVNNYNDFKIKGNTIKNIKDAAITIYTGAADIVKNGFPWGDDFIITNNDIEKCGRGIRYSHEAFPDGSNNTPQNLVINDNTVENLSDPNTPAIFIGNGVIDNLQMNNNQLLSITNKKAIELGKDVHIINAQNNTLDKTMLQLTLPAISK